ncbi:Kinesin-like protein KIF20A [Porphyridium purpureum]|uniref:Kinesin-like protein KIF20A n=1 Tax=Porphyridium purpureum TaxID=35688 RepID=A0A5J4YPI3_PORPP|nr:Kinesin-like protein KIF20A [Porphyridium purpureum]|eukprot:POR6672..scf296_7
MTDRNDEPRDSVDSAVVPFASDLDEYARRLDFGGSTSGVEGTRDSGPVRLRKDGPVLIEDGDEGRKELDTRSVDHQPICDAPREDGLLPTRPGRAVDSDRGWEQRIHVVLRVRPLSEKELARGERNAVNIEGTTRVSITPVAGHAARTKQFEFARVYEPATQQAELFEGSVKEIVERTFHERTRDTLVFAYGATNAGKTFTIHSPDDRIGSESCGMLLRSIHHLFGLIAVSGTLLVTNPQQLRVSFSSRCGPVIGASACFAKLGLHVDQRQEQTQPHHRPSQETSHCAVRSEMGVVVSFCEVYREQLYDLLDAESLQEACSIECEPKKEQSKRRPVLKLREANGKVYIENATRVLLRGWQDAALLLEKAAKKRRTEETHLNSRSSRSHSIFSVWLVEQGSDDISKARTNEMAIVDLAGAERVARSQAKGVQLKESAEINKSLLTLTRVFEALRKQPSSAGSLVPYRDSKLTRLLQPALQTGLVLMLAGVSPAESDAMDSIYSLQCGALAASILSFNGGAVPDERRGTGGHLELKRMEELYREECSHRRRLEHELNAVKMALAAAESKNALMEVELRQEFAEEMAEMVERWEHERACEFEQMVERSERRLQKRIEVVTKSARKQVQLSARRALSQRDTAQRELKRRRAHDDGLCQQLQLLEHTYFSPKFSLGYALTERSNGASNPSTARRTSIWQPRAPLAMIRHSNDLVVLDDRLARFSGPSPSREATGALRASAMSMLHRGAISWFCI